MALSGLSENDRKIILQCLNAISKGNFLEYEYQERLGIELEELNAIVAAYPNIDDSDNESNETLAINNCLNEVCYGIRFSDEEWKQWFDVNKSEIEEVFRKWVRLRGWSETGIR
jgi:UDP-N-acetylmuramyl tripeptide synthase